MESIVEKKSFDFAVRIVNLYKHLTTDKKEFVLSKQLLRSGTSIGASVSDELSIKTQNAECRTQNGLHSASN